MQSTTKIAAVVTALTLVTAGLAIGAPAAGGSIYACLSASSGTLTKVSTKAPKCAKGTTLISWNQSGIQGVAGQNGAKGDVGPRGMAGGQAYAVSLDEKYRFPVLSQHIVQIEGALWDIGEFGSITPLNADTGTTSFYTTPDCSGQMYLPRANESGGGVESVRGGIALKSTPKYSVEGEFNYLKPSKALPLTGIDETSQVKSAWLAPFRPAEFLKFTLLVGFWLDESDSPLEDSYLPWTSDSDSWKGRCVSVDMAALKAWFPSHLAGGITVSEHNKFLSRSPLIPYERINEGAIPSSIGPWYFDFPSD